MKALTGSPGKSVARMIDMPEVPPRAKWLGDLKSSTPSEVKKMPRLSVAKKRSLPGCSLRFAMRTDSSICEAESSS